MSLDFSQGAAIAESIATCIALFVGGVWALHVFTLKRERYPKARISHRFTVLNLDGERRFVRVDLVVENVGQKLLHLRSVTTRLQQVLPLAKIDSSNEVFLPSPSSREPEVAWPTIKSYQHFFNGGEREVEPGESESFQFDYVIDAEISVIQAYSYVTNPAKWTPGWDLRSKKPSEIGWNATDIFALKT